MQKSKEERRGKEKEGKGIKAEMAHPERFELPTDRFVADYSIQLSYGCAGQQALDCMAHPERFELPTDRFVADYSIQLSYGCAVICYCMQSQCDGGEKGIRTLDTIFIVVCSLSRGVPSATRSSLRDCVAALS